ncbi:MAG: carbamoyl phosphate synthase small subunit, partial [Schleiferiaceae bacterium]|nr:carbamoyl phosphate synthase small subunit [Schleiferiaceae bacterium]
TFGAADAPKKVAALDLGIKKNILRCLANAGCEVTVFPYNTPFETLAASGADGYFLSNGPGDPAASPSVIEVAKKMIDSGKPTFGICLGHQMIALASGMRTYKMHNGHRGINHPVKNLKTGKGEITSQNHGFAVSLEDVESHPQVELTHVHLNDGTVAGIRRTDAPVFSVQYHPEASPGPHDSRYLFDEFVTLMNA